MKLAPAPTTTVSTITAQPSATAGTESKPRRRRWTPTEKAEYVALFAESGLTQAEFCRAMDVPAPCFSQWRRGMTPRREPAAGAPHFAEVCLTEPSRRVGAVPALGALQVVLHLPGGVTCEAPVGADPVWLGQVLKALSA
jgi:transposase-like protein